ncbi:hypothetical protein [Galbibacter marinus]|uniref:hypothetical protein n=1 Tax=Galbibacter marinus TaxID=555500 RepID=UPI0012E9995C|nr:hypothetical protein [Galbibacter marinus]
MEVSNVCCIGTVYVDCPTTAVDLKFAELCTSQTARGSKSDKIVIAKSPLHLRISQTIKNVRSETGNRVTF